MISSTGNSRIKRVVHLQNKAKAREQENVFVAEGIKMFLEAPENRIKEVFISASLYDDIFLGKSQKPAQKKLERIPYEVVTGEVFGKMSDTVTPQGILCVVQRMDYSLGEILSKKEGSGNSRIFLLLEGLQDPGNLGTILRTAEGAGISGLIMDKKTVDIYNPKVLRSTMGSIFRVPFVTVDYLHAVAERLKTEGIVLCAAHPRGEFSYDDFTYDKDTAFLIGNEGGGLSGEILEKADSLITIPMLGKVESLNAAVAASLLMYEAAGQIRKKKGEKC